MIAHTRVTGVSLACCYRSRVCSHVIGRAEDQRLLLMAASVLNILKR